MILARICFIFCALFGLVAGCALLDEGAPKKTANNLIATPASYYSTTKARYLGTRYKDNLDRIVERIVRNSKTAPLQFANNISSVGGIGFFTHSATKTPDERYLEVVLATPETFETKGEYSEKIHQIFARYGFDLLSILSGDADMFQDRELTGYGLNLAWRNVVAEGNGSRVAMARAIIYFPKEKVRSFLREEIKQNDLLRDAVIFGEEENGPLALVSYQPQTVRPDVRPAIREDNLTASAEPKPARPPAAATAPTETAAKAAAKPEIVKKEIAPSKAAESAAVTTAPKAQKENKTTPVASAKAVPPPVPPASAPAEAAKKAAPVSAVAPETEKPAAVVALQPVPPIPVESKRPAAPVETTLPAPIAERKAPVKGPVLDPVPPPTASTPKPTAETKAEAKKKDDALSASNEGKLALAETKIAARPVEAAQKPVDDAQRPAPVAPAAKAETKISEVKASVAKSEPVVAPKVVAAPVAPAKLPEAAAETEPKPGAAVAEIKRVEKPEPQVKAIPATPVPVKPLEEIAVKPVEPMMLPAPERPLPPSSVAESKSAEPVKSAPEVKAPAAIAAEKASAPDVKPQVKTVEPPITKPAPVVIRPVAPAPALAPVPAKETKPAEPVKVPSDMKAAPVIAAKKEIVEEKKPQAKPAEAIAMAKPAAEPIAPAPAAIMPAEPARTPVKTEPPTPRAPAPAITKLPAENKSAEKAAGEQLALVRKTPIEMVPENKALSRLPVHKALEGFIIQLAFHDREKARSWAENMERRGYAVSVTEAGTDGALRVRLGNFTVRDEAERQLRTFKQEGISGIIINLPQAFRPEVQSSLP